MLRFELSNFRPQRYIYPRLTRSYQSRHGLRTHQKELLSKLSTSITAVKAAQEETFSVLPRPNPYKEDIKFQDCHSLDSVFTASEKVEDISPMSLLRCAFEELGPKGQAVGTELLFETLEAKNAWVGSEEGAEYAVSKDTLEDHFIFTQCLGSHMGYSQYCTALPPGRC